MAQKDYMQDYRLPLAHRICDKIDLPEDVYRGCCHLEVTSDCYAIVDGCKVSALSGEILEAVDFEVQPDLDYIALCENLQEIQNHNLFL